MALKVEAGTEWDETGPAFCGAILGAIAVVGHELYDVLFGVCPVADPFIHVMTEMAIVVPSGAMVFAGAATIRNRFQTRHLIPNHAAEMLASNDAGGVRLRSLPK